MPLKGATCHRIPKAPLWKDQLRVLPFLFAWGARNVVLQALEVVGCRRYAAPLPHPSRPSRIVSVKFCKKDRW